MATVEQDERTGQLVELYRDGVERLLNALDPETRARLAEDELVGTLMLLHGVYPVSLEERVLEALADVRPYLESHGGNVELLGIEEGIALLRLSGSCDGCAASAATLEQAIEAALEDACPDLLGIDVEGVVAPRAPTAPPPETEWVELDGAAGLARGATTGARGLLIANVAGTLLAYQDRCAACPAPLTGGMLVGGRLTCSACGTTFDLPRAGRCVGDETLQLEPVPLLRNGGPVRVALPAGAQADPETAHCELCPIGIGEGHRHLLHLVERRIVCVCETCWSLHSGDPEYRPPGQRTLVLDDFVMTDDVWAAFQIPIGLTFLLRSSVTGSVVALYPSPAGATESELELVAWDALREANPILERLEPDAEALIVDRTGDEHRYAIVPVDQCYRMVGMIKARWEGITGGQGVDAAIDDFFEFLRGRAYVA
jgi:Fe-S cluster biogenesis protein NfuA/nitrite reductase/ring-hydroxylating ferredoxin subunit